MGVHDMEICSNGHPPIVHTEGYKNCPLCKMKEECNGDRIRDLEEVISNLEDDRDDLEHSYFKQKRITDQLRQKLKEHGIEE